jgi:hypothetical protein
MRKYFVVLVAAVALVAFSMPAAAVDIGASGFYHGFAILSNFQDGGGGPSLRAGTDVNGEASAEQTNAYVAQRFRVKWTFGNENVKAVWYLESDMIWGDAAGSVPTASCRNCGGALGADKVQTETKQINVWFKIPNTSMESTVGIQTVPGHYSGIFNANNDMAGITFKGKYEPVSYSVVWAKLYENNTNNTDDATLYEGRVQFAPNKESTLGITFDFLQDDTGAPTGGLPRLQFASGPDNAPINFSNYKGKLYMPGVDGSIKVGPVKISGWLLYQTGTYESTLPNTNDVDVSGFAANLRGDMTIGPGKAFLEGLYISGDDDVGDDNFDSIITLGDFQQNASPGGYAGYSKPHMVILFSTWNMASISQCIIGCSGAEYGDSYNNSGRGIWFIGGGYNQKFTDKLWGEFNVGYLQSTELYQFDRDGGRDKDMGTEINATVGLEIQKGLQVSVTGAYVFFGDFVRDLPDTTAGFAPTDVQPAFKDAWTSYARLDYKF